MEKERKEQEKKILLEKKRKEKEEKVRLERERKEQEEKIRLEKDQEEKKRQEREHKQQEEKVRQEKAREELKRSVEEEKRPRDVRKRARSEDEGCGYELTEGCSEVEETHGTGSKRAKINEAPLQHLICLSVLELTKGFRLQFGAAQEALFAKITKEEEDFQNFIKVQLCYFTIAWYILVLPHLALSMSIS